MVGRSVQRGTTRTALVGDCVEQQVVIAAVQLFEYDLLVRLQSDVRYLLKSIPGS